LQLKDGTEFGASVSACPKLDYIAGYKFWGIDEISQTLHLPECTSNELDRSDDLNHLELWAPKLSSLTLQTCYDMEHLRILPKDGAPIKVNLLGTQLDKKSLQHLEQHPRVGPSNIKYEDDPMIAEMLEDHMNRISEGYPETEPDHPKHDTQFFQMLEDLRLEARMHAGLMPAGFDDGFASDGEDHDLGSDEEEEEDEEEEDEGGRR